MRCFDLDDGRGKNLKIKLEKMVYFENRIHNRGKTLA
jgi:hypothetical protein